MNCSDVDIFVQYSLCICLYLDLYTVQNINLVSVRGFDFVELSFNDVFDY